MEVILLERVRNLGQIGSRVSVKLGYARNYLVPYGKAVKATKGNLEKFDKIRAELESREKGLLESAKARALELEGLVVLLEAKATEDGKLFGSVSKLAIVKAFERQGVKVEKSEIDLPQGVIRQLGDHQVNLLLHGDVTTTVVVKVVSE